MIEVQIGMQFRVLGFAGSGAVKVAVPNFRAGCSDEMQTDLFGVFILASLYYSNP